LKFFFIWQTDTDDTMLLKEEGLTASVCRQLTVLTLKKCKTQQQLMPEKK
jgi:hypothetical protein